MFGSKRIITKYDYERIQDVLNKKNISEHNPYIKKLKKKFKKAKFVDSKQIKSTVITMNSKFRLKNLGNGYKMECALVFPDDSDPGANRFSIFDSIGSEIFAHEVGEVIHLGSGEDTYFLIENILYQPESAGDYTL